jgi:membrane-bound inhibitor of C-type lysozyme
MKKYQAPLSLSLYLAILLTGCASAGAGGDVPVYDMNSWKTIIADDCRAFFDGCNQCVREPGKAAACTRMACAEYQQPQCRDEAAPASVSAASKPGKTVDYACAEGARFAVTYHEFVQDDQRIRLGNSEIMLRDAQTQSVYRLQRERSASGEKYADAAGLQFFGKGREARVTQQGQRLYADCVQIQ